MNRKRDGDRNITVGNISRSNAVAIGDNASASVHQPRPPAREELIAALSDFIQSLGPYEDSLPNSQAIRESAEAVRAEVKRPSPRWHVIRNSLKRIAASVTSVGALTEAINNLQTLVAHIAR